MEKFVHKDHTADIIIEGYGTNLSELFANTALGLTDIMVDFGQVEGKVTMKVEVESSQTDLLLFDFLSELLYIKDTKRIVFIDFDVRIEGLKLVAKCKGEAISAKHEHKVDVKAITLHNLKIEQSEGKFVSHVLVDI